jgi:anti-sigma-K factor RskA
MNRKQQGGKLKHERVTEEIRELAALYALGALTQHEARSFKIHLRDCAVCKSELSRSEHAAAGIGLAAEEVETPDYVRDLLIARVEREPRVSVSIDSSNTDSPPLNTPSQIYEPKSEPKKHRSKLDWALRIAFIVLVLANLWAFYNLHSTQALNARMAIALSDSQIAGDVLKKELEGQKKQPKDLEQILEIAGKSEARVARLTGQPPAPSSSGTLFWNARQHRYLLMGSFPPAPQGKAYQLWLVTPARKISAGLVYTNSDGSAFVVSTISEDSPDATAAGITLEREGGSSTPTTHFCTLGSFN